MLLSHRIKQSVIARKHDGSYLALNDSGVNLSSDFEILEFIPAAYELFDGINEYKGDDAHGDPIIEEGIYSGYADLANSSIADGLKSPGSKFNNAFKNGVKDLTCENDSDEEDINSGARCINADDENSGLVAIFSSILYKVSTSFGYQENFNPNQLDIAKVGIQSIDTLKISNDFKNKKISEQYKLAYTAIAIAPAEQSAKDIQNGVFDLKMYYNYRPWLNESFKKFSSTSTKAIKAESATLAKHVTRFVLPKKTELSHLNFVSKQKNQK
ncbi:prepilin-type N-terminal cleavage/methylation domain-containing protein [Campylobacter sp.]|uniref:prepilin-type N-terminal cleavage/methylation domain-containing protein n=1 Tax=Campylobacter sp. TaxID=205 RepID=UPI003FA0C38B